MSKTTVIIIILSLVTLVLVLARVYLNLTAPPASPATPTPAALTPALTPLPHAPSNTSFQFTGSPPTNLPAQLPLYTLIPAPLTNPETIAAQLSFTQPPLISTASSFIAYRWQQPNFGSLAIFTSPDSLSVNYYRDPPPSPPATPEAADASLITFLQSLGLSSITLTHPQRTYFRANNINAVSEPAPARANLIQTDYAYDLDGYPLYISTNPLFSVKAAVLSDNSLQQLDFYPPPKTHQTSVANLINVTAASTKLYSNAGVLVKALPNIATEITVDPDFEHAVIDSVNLIYIYDLPTGLALPMYRFTGTAPHRTLTNMRFAIEYLVPAIE